MLLHLHSAKRETRRSFSYSILYIYLLPWSSIIRRSIGFFWSVGSFFLRAIVTWSLNDGRSSVNGKFSFPMSQEHSLICCYTVFPLFDRLRRQCCSVCFAHCNWITVTKYSNPSISLKSREKKTNYLKELRDFYFIFEQGVKAYILWKRAHVQRDALKQVWKLKNRRKNSKALVKDFWKDSQYRKTRSKNFE